MRNAGGYAFFINPAAAHVWLDDRSSRPEMMCEGVTEMDTFTCGHCCRVIHVKAMQRPEDLGGLCKRCMKLECPECVDKGCTPFEKKLEMAEARDRALRSYGV